MHNLPTRRDALHASTAFASWLVLGSAPGNAAPFTPRGLKVIDYSRRDLADTPTPIVVPDFKAMAKAGVHGVIRKGTDPRYDWQGHPFLAANFNAERAAARAAGLMWGSYNFGRKRSMDSIDVGGREQADFYLDSVQPAGDEMVCLDWEDDFLGDTGRAELEPTMTQRQAVDFVERVRERLGRYPLLNVTTSFLEEKLVTRSGEQRDLLKKCKLWVSHEVNVRANWDFRQGPRLPPGIAWKNTLWQWARDVPAEGDKKYGYERAGLPGIRRCDHNVFNGSSQELKLFWTT